MVISGLRIVEPALQDSVFDDVDAAAKPELAHRIRLMRLHGLDAQRELAGDFLVAVAGGNQPEYARLAVAEFAARFRRLVGPSEEPCGHPGGQRGIDIL